MMDDTLSSNHYQSSFRKGKQTRSKHKANTKQTPTKFNDHRKYIMVMGNPAWKLISWCLWSGWGSEAANIGITVPMTSHQDSRSIFKYRPRMINYDINYDKDSPLSECMREARHRHRLTRTHFPGHPRFVSSGIQLSQMSFPVREL